METEERRSIATTILCQISRDTRMAIGARDYRHGEKNGGAYLSMKIGGRMKWIFVTLDPSDTYTVELATVDKSRTRKVLASCSDVYCDQLGEIIYDMVNKPETRRIAA